MNIYCPECEAQENLSPERWRCDCGSAWEPVERADFDPAHDIDLSELSIAEGLAIAAPVRGRRILQAIRETGGTCITVEDEATLQAQRQLVQRGLYVEPTSATVVAALDVVLRQAAPDDTIVVPLTGSGLKGSPRV